MVSSLPLIYADSFFFLYPIYRYICWCLYVCVFVLSLLLHSLYSCCCHALLFHNKLELTKTTNTYNNIKLFLTLKIYI